MRNKVNFTMDIISRLDDVSYFTSAKIFDDLLIVASKETASHILKTDSGIVIFDGIWPDERVYNAIIAAIEEAGWEPKDISKYFVTHGHVDHTGCGKWFKEKHGATTYLSEVDDIYWKEHPLKPDRAETLKDFDIDVYLNDGDEIDCGNLCVKVMSTPGHTPGCLSYFFPVHENGRQYTAAIFGGATPPWNNPEGIKTQIDSIARFKERAKSFHAEVALSGHTVFDNGLERIEYSKKRTIFLPNIYLLGEDGFQNFCDSFSSVIPEID